MKVMKITNGNGQEITAKEFIENWDRMFEANDEPKNLTWHCMCCNNPYKANWNSSDYCSKKCRDKMNKDLFDRLSLE